MKHFPATRGPARFSGLTTGSMRAPAAFTGARAALLAALFYVTGFFTGAILFGEALLRLRS